MNAGQYNQIVTRLTNLTEECKYITSRINSEDSFEALTIKEAKELVARARKMQGNMDTFFANELYHIMGMGKLTVGQRNQFWSLVEEWLKYRSFIKPIATIQFSNTPVIPNEESTYHCQIMGINLKAQNNSDLLS